MNYGLQIQVAPWATQVVEMSIQPGGGCVRLGSRLAAEPDSSCAAPDGYHHRGTQTQGGQ